MINVNLPTPNFWKCKDLNVNVKSLQSIIEADNFIKINTLPKIKSIAILPLFSVLYFTQKCPHYRLKMGCNCSFMFTFGSPVKNDSRKKMLKRINKYKMLWQTILTENGSSNILKYTVQLCCHNLTNVGNLSLALRLHLHTAITHVSHCKNNKSSMVVRYPNTAERSAFSLKSMYEIWICTVWNTYVKL